jgi:O-antigen polymerase
MTPPTQPNSWSHRPLLVLGVSVFVGLYVWAYVHFVSQEYSSYGFDYQPVPDFYLALAWILAILPSFWMPIKLRRPSQLAYWVLYLTVVIPSMFVPLFAGLNKPAEIVPLMLAMCAGTGVLGAGYLFPLHRFHAAKISPNAFWAGFVILAVLTTLAIVVFFWGKMHLVAFDEIYDLRDNAQDRGGFLNYALMWSYGAVYPFLIGWGLYHRRWLLFLMGCLGQVLVYSCFGTKASLLSIVFIAGIYFLLCHRRGPFALKLVWAVAGILLVLVAVFLVEGEEPDLVTQLLMFLVMFRSFGLSGLLTGQYYDFFQHNPHTLFSHLKVANWLVHYPFHYPLGTEIGYYHYGALVDTTAHFWATDGIAALGLPGILVASVLCASLFWLVDSAAAHHDPRFVSLVTFYGTYSLANLSLFTTFLSGGLGLLILLLHALPPVGSPAGRGAFLEASTTRLDRGPAGGLACS